MKAALPIALLAATLSLAACKGHASKQADALDNAAAQSDPAAASVLENAADAMRNGTIDASNASAQDVMQAAGDAAAANPNDAAQPSDAADKQAAAGAPSPTGLTK